MFLLFWSAKGGSGVTVVAAATAVLAARTSPTVLIDLGGDAPVALGLSEGAGPGVLDWLVAPNAGADGLFRLAREAGDGLRVVPTGSGSGHPLDEADWERLGTACATHRGALIVDAGPLVPPTAAHQHSERSLLVTRPCFLSLRRAAQHNGLASAVVLVTEPGRALTATDVERALGLAVVAEVAWDPAVARSVDAGLLSSRLPGALSRSLRRVVAPVTA